MLLNDKKVFVGKFLSRQERLKKLGERAKQFTNVYIKNFSDKLDEEDLKKMFEVRYMHHFFLFYQETVILLYFFQKFLVIAKINYE